MPTFRSFAKVNLHLEVVGRREDGYHELRTLFQTIDLADELEVERGGRGVALEVVGAELPAGPGNLAWRAAAAFLARWAEAGEGVRLRLTKRIPAGGGLGGGSANAATVLLALCAVWNLRPAYAELWREARELGADVPFFLVGGTALGFGRGDEIVPLPDPAGPALELWLAMPPFAVPTRAVFGALEGLRRRQPSALLLAAEIGAAPPRERGWVGDNDLEPRRLPAATRARGDIYSPGRGGSDGRSLVRQWLDALRALRRPRSRPRGRGRSAVRDHLVAEPRARPRRLAEGKRIRRARGGDLKWRSPKSASFRCTRRS